MTRVGSQRHSKKKKTTKSSMQITLTNEVIKRPVMRFVFAAKDITAILVHRFNSCSCRIDW